MTGGWIFDAAVERNFNVRECIFHGGSNFLPLQHHDRRRGHGTNRPMSFSLRLFLLARFLVSKAGRFLSPPFFLRGKEDRVVGVRHRARGSSAPHAPRRRISGTSRRDAVTRDDAKPDGCGRHALGYYHTAAVGVLRTRPWQNSYP